jgi:hypothetical protein
MITELPSCLYVYVISITPSQLATAGRQAVVADAFWPLLSFWIA